MLCIKQHYIFLLPNAILHCRKTIYKFWLLNISFETYFLVFYNSNFFFCNHHSLASSNKLQGSFPIGLVLKVGRWHYPRLAFLMLSSWELRPFHFFVSSPMGAPSRISRLSWRRTLGSHRYSLCCCITSVKDYTRKQNKSYMCCSSVSIMNIRQTFSWLKDLANFTLNASVHKWAR